MYNSFISQFLFYQGYIRYKESTIETHPAPRSIKQLNQIRNKIKGVFCGRPLRPHLGLTPIFTFPTLTNMAPGHANKNTLASRPPSPSKSRLSRRLIKKMFNANRLCLLLTSTLVHANFWERDFTQLSHKVQMEF